MKKINKFLKRLLQEQRRQKKSEKLLKSLGKKTFVKPFTDTFFNPNISPFTSDDGGTFAGTELIPDKETGNVLSSPLSPFTVFWVQEGECSNHSIPSSYICGQPGEESGLNGTITFNPLGPAIIQAGSYQCADPNVLTACTDNTWECFTQMGNCYVMQFIYIRFNNT